METTETKQKIDWLSPTETVTTEDFRAMVHEAESEPGMNLSEYKSKMNLWWEKHL